MRHSHDALLFLCIESVADPIDRGVRKPSVDGHHIESARPLIADSLHHDVMFGGRHKSRSFARVNANQPAAERMARSPSHLDEDECFCVAHDKIDLTASAPVVAHDEYEAPPREIAFRKPFGVASDCARAIGPAMVWMVQRPCRSMHMMWELRRRIEST